MKVIIKKNLLYGIVFLLFIPINIGNVIGSTTNIFPWDNYQPIKTDDLEDWVPHNANIRDVYVVEENGTLYLRMDLEDNLNIEEVLYFIQINTSNETYHILNESFVRVVDNKIQPYGNLSFAYHPEAYFLEWAFKLTEIELDAPLQETLGIGFATSDSEYRDWDDTFVYYPEELSGSLVVVDSYFDSGGSRLTSAMLNTEINARIQVKALNGSIRTGYYLTLVKEGTTSQEDVWTYQGISLAEGESYEISIPFSSSEASGDQCVIGFDLTYLEGYFVELEYEDNIIYTTPQGYPPRLRVLAPTGTMSITCQDELGNPIEDANVVIGSVHSGEHVLSLQSNNEGVAVFNDIRISDYFIFISKDGYEDAENEVTIDEGEMEILILSLQAKTSNLKVHVVDPSGEPVVGVLIISTSQPIGQSVLNRQTDSEGNVNFEDIRWGNYTFQISKEGFENSTVDKEIEYQTIYHLSATLDTTSTGQPLETSSEQQEKGSSGIPGFPLISIIIGLLVAYFIFTRKYTSLIT